MLPPPQLSECELKRELKRAVHCCTVERPDRCAFFKPIEDALTERPDLAPFVVELVLARYRIGSTL